MAEKAIKTTKTGQPANNSGQREDCKEVQKPTVCAISLQCGIGVKEVHTRKSLNV